MPISRTRQLGAGALVVLGLVTGCAADQDPDPAREAVLAAPSPSTASPGSSTSPPGPPPALPDTYVAAVDAQLVVDQVARSAPRTLARYDPPPAPGYTGEPPSYLDGVELSPDGATAYADVCCEPVPGLTAGFPVDGSPGPDLPVMSAHSPAVSTDGRSLVGFSLEMLVTKQVSDPGRQTVTLLSFAPEDGLRREALAWSPDGRLAFLETPVGEQAGPSRVVVMRPREAPRSYSPPQGQTYAAPAFRADGMLVVARQPDDAASTAAATGVVLDPDDGRVVAEFALDGRVVDQDYDRSGTFLLTTYGDGRLAWQGGGRSGVLRTSGTTSAAW